MQKQTGRLSGRPVSQRRKGVILKNVGWIEPSENPTNPKMLASDFRSSIRPTRLDDFYVVVRFEKLP
jgi:hypothetical protein